MIQAILVAAGLSSRMGEINKLLLPYQGQPIVRLVAQQILNANIQQLLVVTGFEADRVRTALEGLPLDFIHNQDYELGLTSSIKKGAEAVDQDMLICLGDMPLLTTAHYNLLIQQFNKAQKAYPIVAPFNGSYKGNPVLFHRKYKSEILALPDHLNGCKPVVQANKVNLALVQTQEIAYFSDVDTPESYQALLQYPKINFNYS